MAYIIEATSGKRRERIDHARDIVEAEYLTEQYQLTLGDGFKVTYRAIYGKKRTNGRQPLIH